MKQATSAFIMSSMRQLFRDMNVIRCLLEPEPETSLPSLVSTHSYGKGEDVGAIASAVESPRVVRLCTLVFFVPFLRESCFTHRRSVWADEFSVQVLCTYLKANSPSVCASSVACDMKDLVRCRWTFSCYTPTRIKATGRLLS